MLEPAVELGIVPPVFDELAGVGDGGPVAVKQNADLGQAEAADDMSEIHGDLARERSAR